MTTADRYPNKGYPTRLNKRSKKPCCVCGVIAIKQIDIQVSWFRGDDVVVHVCHEHAKIPASELLLTDEAKKQ